jgi:hypothetical protein
VTKYLGKEPFSSKAATDEYRRGFDETFGKKHKCKCGIIARALPGHRAPQGWQWVSVKVGWICEDCQ